MLYLTTLILSLVVTIAVMPYAKQLALRLHSVDNPGQRKVHDRVMPKCGGMAMAVGAITPILLWVPMTPFIKGLMMGTLIIVLFGVADDIKDLSPYQKLSGQLVGASLAIFVGGVKISDLGAFLPEGMLLPDWAAIPLTMVVIIGVTNATNLSDGLDGLAGGIALLIFLCIGYLGFKQSDWTITLIAVAVGGAVLGFLRFNSYPAQLFMGDAGSQLLGFVAILLCIQLTQQAHAFSAILPLIILGLPILDTLSVMVKRLATGRSPFSADRNHFHHQLIKFGLYHSEAVLCIYIFQSLLITIATRWHDLNDWLLLIGYLLFSGLLVGSFSLLEKRDYRINRDRFLNRLKKRLQPLKDRGQMIKVSYGVVKIGVPSLLLFNLLAPSPNDRFYPMLLGGFISCLIISRLVGKTFQSRVFKIGIYILTPFFIYRCDVGLYSYLKPNLITVYNCLYLILIAAVIMTLKLTRRTHGFKSSTLDFLVIFIILLIPNLPGLGVEGYYLGLVAAKTVVLFYGYEVLVGEMRNKFYGIPISLAIFVVGLRGLLMF